MDQLAEKYPSHSPYNYTLNNPTRYIDPDGNDVWEKNGNWWNDKGWRDDTVEENYAEGDYENASVQIAEEVGINTENINVEYDDTDTEPRHFTTVKNDKITVVTTKGGFENLDEKNIDNSRNSVVHEKTHTEEGKSTLIKARTDAETRIKIEKTACKAQQKDKTWDKTSETYKNKMIKYKEHWENMEKVGKQLNK